MIGLYEPGEDSPLYEGATFNTYCDFTPEGEERAAAMADAIWRMIGGARLPTNEEDGR